MNTTNIKDLIVVGIGSSAGGLDACRKLLTSLPTGNICYVLCQHLSPHHESMLCEILSRETKLSVLTITQNLILQPGNFYIAPPNSDIVLKDDTLSLLTPPQSSMPKPNINRFFESLAEAKHASAIGVILSGSGSDGAIGATKIKSMGGVVCVQDPETSQYDSMPNAAIHSHAVDLIASAEEIGKRIKRIVEAGGIDEVAKLISPENNDTYTHILKFISQATQVDFLHYKKSTISRRLARRMAMQEVSNSGEYLEYLKRHPAESWAFVKDAFIVVSQFYRVVFRNLCHFSIIKKTGVTHDSIFRLQQSIS